MNNLLKQGAKLVETIDDVLEELAPQLELGAGAADAEIDGPDAGGVEGDLMDLLSDVPTHVDDLAGSTGLDAGDLLGFLLSMEARGLIKSLPGKFYVRL